MADKATDTDRDDDDEDEDDEEEEGEESPKPAAKAESKDEKKDVKKDEPKPAAAPASKEAAKKSDDDDEDDDDEEDDEDEDDDDEDDEEEAKPAAKPSAIAEKSGARPAPAKPGAITAKTGPASGKPGAAAAKPGAAKPGAKPMSKAMPAKKPPQKQGGSFSKSLILFIIIFGGLALVFVYLNRGDDGGVNKPKWSVGQTVDVNVTLVKSDSKDLACSSPDEVAGKHCAFEADGKPWSKGSTTDDKVVLRPYTTTDRIQFVADGLWSQPAMAEASLPVSRFNVACKLKVTGKMAKLGVRWTTEENKWFEQKDWYVGDLSDCKVTP